MERPVTGDVVVLDFPHAGLRAWSRRPAIVLAPGEGGDLILCQVTRQGNPDRYHIPISAADFETGSLRHDSFARPARLFTASPNAFRYSAGRLRREKLVEILDQLTDIVHGS